MPFINDRIIIGVAIGIGIGIDPQLLSNSIPIPKWKPVHCNGYSLH
ncbi:MAG: hypothetical protein JW915_22450 [Chitinispirillaceae bacterium]|nr:hypothetical protein [Chitinispirillaceae bacterium]